MITEPGIYYRMPAEEYHADPCPSPSLSASLIKILCHQSPLHAWTAHPKLNPKAKEEESEIFDLGKLAHALLLEGVNNADVLDFADWRTKAAKEAREASRTSGRVPILAKHWTRVEEMLASTREQLSRHREAHNSFTDGEPEVTLIWIEDGIWCRARLDWWTKDRKRIDDYKTTGVSANPEMVSRNFCANGYDIQQAWYRRGVQALTNGVDPQFRFIVQETAAPYALSVNAAGPDVEVIGEKKCMWALEKFGECLRSGVWPGFAGRTHWAELTPWEEERWLRKEMA